MSYCTSHLSDSTNARSTVLIGNRLVPGTHDTGYSTVGVARAALKAGKHNFLVGVSSSRLLVFPLPLCFPNPPNFSATQIQKSSWLALAGLSCCLPLECVLWMIARNTLLQLNSNQNALARSLTSQLRVKQGVRHLCTSCRTRT